MPAVIAYEEAIADEIRQTPREYLPALLQMIHLFRTSVALPPAAESFEQGWREAQAGETLPVSQLWEGIDAC
jgi:hypothetical protein